MKFSTTIRQMAILAGLVSLSAGVAPLARAQGSSYMNPGYVPSELPPNAPLPQLKTVDIEEKLGEQADLDLVFYDENGDKVKLGEFFHKGRPVILDLVYYECPQLCTLVLNNQVTAMRGLDWMPGKEYEIVTISIDPREHFGQAREKKGTYLSSFDRPAPGWHFLTDYHGNVKKLAEQVGFHYTYDERIDQFAHAAGIMIMTPEGKMARYLYGVSYKPQDLRFGLSEAAENRLVYAADKLLLFCFQYDPAANRYVLFATNFMKVGGALTVLLFALFWWRMAKADRKKQVTPAASA